MLGIIFICSKVKYVSSDEKRQLAHLPEWNLDSIADGIYMTRIDEFVRDHFPFRDAFISQSFILEKIRGYHDDELIIIKAKPIIKKKKSDTITLDTGRVEDFAAEIIEDNRGLVISNGRAMQLFGGNNKQAKNYGNMVNAYYNELKAEGINIFSVVVPSAAEFYLPWPKFKHLKEQEKRNINLIYETEVEGIKSVDAYSKIAEHRNEYVYFRTDHHWTGLGAYYAYTAFCETAGFVAVPLDRMTEKTKNKFYGSLYFYLDKNAVLGEHYDTVHYFKTPGTTTCLVYKKTDIHKAIKSHVIVDAAGGYSVFLGADYPLIKIETEVKNGRSIVVVKNSYGNPFTTYLVSHYEKVFVVDYRYYNTGIIDLIRENKITDLLFINGSISANTPYHAQRIKRIMYTGKKTKPVLKDSTNVKTVKDTLK